MRKTASFQLSNPFRNTRANKTRVRITFSKETAGHVRRNDFHTVIETGCLQQRNTGTAQRGSYTYILGIRPTRIHLPTCIRNSLEPRNNNIIPVPCFLIFRTRQSFKSTFRIFSAMPSRTKRSEFKIVQRLCYLWSGYSTKFFFSDFIYVQHFLSG